MPQCCNKQNAFIAGFLVASYFIGNLGPFGFSSLASVSTVDDFCNSSSTNRAICDSHHEYPGKAVPLDKAFRDSSESMFMFSAFISAVLSGTAAFFGYVIAQTLKKNAHHDDAQTVSHHNSHSSACARLFNRFKENVLPTRYEVGSLIGISLAFIALGSLTMWLTRTMAYSAICLNDGQFDQQLIVPNNTICNGTFPTLHQSDAKEIQGLAEEVQSNMLAVGISLILIAGTAISVCAMSTIACVKGRVSARHEGLLARSRANINDTDDSDDRAMSYGTL